MSRSLRVLAGPLVFAAMAGAVAPASAATTISTADYATQFCRVGGPFRTAISLASNSLSGSATDLPTARAALVKFADDTIRATETFRGDLAKLRRVKSPAVRALNTKTIAKLRSIEQVLATTKADAISLSVTDQSAFGIRLVLVQKDLQKVSDGYASIGKIKYPKELDRAVANDPVCQQVQGATQTTTAP